MSIPNYKYSRSKKAKKASRDSDYPLAPELTKELLERERLHIVNLDRGQFTDSGFFPTSKDHINKIIDHLRDAVLPAAEKANKPLRIALYAHGGLNSEKDALFSAATYIPWWRENGIYPIYFIWRTGAIETISHMIRSKWRELVGGGGERGLWDSITGVVTDHATDPAIEGIARLVHAREVWTSMKENADQANDPASEENGGNYVAKRLAKLLKDYPDGIEIHTVGHSAGSIFHAHFMDTFVRKVNSLSGSRIPIKTCQFLAPAITTDLFKKINKRIASRIGKLTMYTMRDKHERDDSTFGVYKKSLLYLIHYALEEKEGTQLLGLEESVKADPDLDNLFNKKRGDADVVWSVSKPKAGPNFSSDSTTHGGFDNDRATMESVCRRILDRDDDDEAPLIAPFPFYVQFNKRSIERAVEFYSDEEYRIRGILCTAANRIPPPLPDIPEVPNVSPSSKPNRPSKSSRRALCIGIDNYPDPQDRLSGCIADARLWQVLFGSLGFDTEILLDQQATYESITGGLRKLIRDAKAGDVIAIQFAGHGVSVPDLSGDEGLDGKDEALCCYDARKGKLVLDDHLGKIIDALPAGVNLTAFLDCCHSGSGTRFATSFSRTGGLPSENMRPRLMKADQKLFDAHRDFIRGGNYKKSEKGGAGGRGFKAKNQNPYARAAEILFSGCQPSELSFEKDNQGVFTAAAARVIRDGIAGLTNADFAERVRRVVASEDGRQRPGLYAAQHHHSRSFLCSIT